MLGRFRVIGLGSRYHTGVYWSALRFIAPNPRRYAVAVQCHLGPALWTRDAVVPTSR